MTEPLRLSKRMSELGLCSRREADEWIARGWVRVDGVVVSELGSKVLPHQKVTVERQAAAEQSKRVTVLVHKPVGFVSGQAEDGYRPAVVLVTPENRWEEDRAPMRFHPTQLRSLVPAGRLRATTDYADAVPGADAVVVVVPTSSTIILSVHIKKHIPIGRA